jgi:hypothetical protein
MIKDIKEINLPEYATLHEAEVTLNAMGENTITAQVRIDGDITPSFIGTDGEPWTLEFKGSRYVLPQRAPQAEKSNERRSSVVDLTFQDEAVYQLKRYYFAEMTSIESGTAIADKYIASLNLTLPNFVEALNKVLDYYFDGKITADLNGYPDTPYSTEPTGLEIDHSYIWDVLQELNEAYDVRWKIEYNSYKKVHTIRIGYQAGEVTHTFEYGFKGGLLKFERQVQSDEIKNIILGRGGDTNLPKLYFKDYSKYPTSGGTGDNGVFTPDPDAVPELANIYFDGLRDSNFRLYVQGWKAQKGYDGATYESGKGWAYEKGYTDTKFNPVEYVKDDDSIAKYGEIWGALDTNEDIYPSIQGVTVDPYGRVDEVVAVSEVVTDDIDKLSETAVTKTNVYGASYPLFIEDKSYATATFRGVTFSVPEGETAYLTYSPYVGETYTSKVSTGGRENGAHVNVDKLEGGWVTIDTEHSYVKVYNASTDEEVNVSAIPAGDYYYVVTIRAYNDYTKDVKSTVGIQQVCCFSSNPDREEWKPTFDIWVKNIWGTSKNDGESGTDYALRVWKPILGDGQGNEAKVVFSDGFLAVTDYEFAITDYAYDTSKSYGGVASEWKLTLAKSDAEYSATGLYIPNATTGGNARAGDHFYFTGCDLPAIYVNWAEQKLTAYKETEGLAENSEIQPSWVITLDKVRLNTPDEQLNGGKLINELVVGAVANIRDKRFTNNETLQLYINTLTYKWSEGDIVPDVEITLSDNLAVARSLSEILRGEISSIRREYVSADTLAKTVENVAGGMFLRKTGISDVSYSPTAFAATVTSSEFEAGDVGGKGWGMYKDGEQMDVFEVDKLIVRKEMHVNQITVNQVAYVGGKQIISAACIECTRVDDTDDGYVCHFDHKNGSVVNLFALGDVAMSQVFDSAGAETKYYKRRVVAVGEESITLSKTYVQGSGIPAAGDVIVQYGSYTDSTRRYVIVRDVIGGGYERMISGLSSVYTDGTEYYFAGRMDGSTPRVFIGDTSNYIEYQDGQLHIKADVELEEGSDLDNRISEIDSKTTDNITQIASKSKVFYTTPKPPYNEGDLWVNATYGQYSNDLLRVKDGCSKASGESFSISDWELATGYTGDGALNEFLNGAYKDFTAEIKTQVDSKAETFYQTSDPSASWTDAEKSSHAGDLWYDTNPDSNGLCHTYVYSEDNGAYSWTEITGVPQSVFDTIDGKASIFVSRPSTYRANDLWIIESGLASGYMPSGCQAGDIVVSSETRTGSYTKTDWTKRDRYTDDTNLNNFIGGDYKNFVDNIQSQVDKKAETFYQASDPSSSWTASEKASHVGDLWYDTTADANGNCHTYVYKKDSSGNYGWEEVNGVPKDVFDTLDGKASIFVSKPSTYNANDLWIIESGVSASDLPSGCSAGDIVVSSKSRVDAYTKTDWTKRDRYTDDTKIDGLLDNINNDNVLSLFEKLTLRARLKEINPSETGTVTISDASIDYSTSSEGGNPAWTLVDSGDYKGYYQSENHTSSGYSINEFGLTCSAATTLKVKVVLSSEAYYDYAAISEIDGSMSYSGSAFTNYKDLIKGDSSSARTVEKEYTFDLTEGEHTIQLGYRKDGSGDYGDDCVYVLFEFTSAVGSLNTWIRVCLKSGADYSAAVSAANALFGYLYNPCFVWEDTDTVFSDTGYLTTINSLLAAYNAAIDVAVVGMPDFQYLKKALGEDTGTLSVSGGIALGTFIGVKDSGSNVVAAINATTAIGNSPSNGRLMVFAGAESAQKASSAAFRVYENGFLYAGNAEIRGRIYADSGEFRGNIIIGEAKGRRIEIKAGGFGAVDMFDTGGNVTTHIGNNYCPSISEFASTNSTNSPTIPSSAWSGTFSDTVSAESFSFDNSGPAYMSRSFTISGDPTTNILSGSITCAVNYTDSVSETPVNAIGYVAIYACTDSAGSNPVSLGSCEFDGAQLSFSGTIAVNAVLGAGTYYLFVACSGEALFDTSQTRTVTATVTVSSATCTVTSIAQKLEIFANGIGYKYSTAQYFALLRETTSYSGAGNLALKMRTGTASSPKGFDVTSSGVKLYGKTRKQLGTTTSSSATFSLSESPDNYSFIEIRAAFKSGEERVVMTMSTEEWNSSSSSYSFLLSTDSSYVYVHRYSSTQARTKTSTNLTSVTIFGLL